MYKKTIWIKFKKCGVLSLSEYPFKENKHIVYAHVGHIARGFTKTNGR